MPYAGPSRGCETCKKRHIKAPARDILFAAQLTGKQCDEKEPTCTACVKSKKVCPGYKDSFDLLVRDQTEGAREAVERGMQGFRKRTQIVPTPAAWTEAREQQALCYFFTNYVLIERQEQVRRGYLEYLLPLYSESKPGSPLSLATAAISLCIFGAHETGALGTETSIAREPFGKALALTKKAILDPVESRSDELLMTVLILGMYEGLTKTMRSQKSSGQHTEGAVALVKHRGSRNFTGELSKRLLVAVRSQNVARANIDQEIWEDPEDMPRSPAILLDSMCKEALELPPEEADSLLSTWPSQMPASWHPIRMATTMQSYHGCDIYPDLMVMSLYNHWRCARIDAGGPIQGMVDGICASVPFAVGNRTKPGPLGEIGVKYPHLDGAPTSREHYRIAHNLGGFFLLKPLMRVINVKADLRQGQREWAMGQLRRIGIVWNVNLGGR